VRPDVLGPVDRSAPVARRVVDQLLDGIRRGRYPAGSPLPSEQEIAGLCAVSRPSVREALSALQFAGYVESRRGSGTIVLASDPPSPVPADGGAGAEGADPLALLEARLVIEPEAVALAAGDPDLEALDAASVLVRGMGVAVEEGVLDAGTDLRVHVAVLGVCRNPILREQTTRLLRGVADPAWQRARDRAWTMGQLPRLWAEQHRRIFDAVAAGEPARAAAACREHLHSVARNLLRHGELPPSERRRLQAILRQAEERQGEAPAPTAASRSLESPAAPPAGHLPRAAVRGRR